MMKRLLVLAVACLAMTTSLTLYGQTTISGVVTDADLGDPLIGANLIIQGTAIGASTDLDGTFEISSETPLPWTIEVSYTGFAPQELNITGNQTGMAIKLAAGALLGQEVVISASRRREKIQEAPASISVFTARKLEASPNTDPARNLINAPGVTVQQQTAGRINIQLRGDGGIFGSASFPIQDYRSLSGPGLGTFNTLNSPISGIDLERIEVVRGPGSALYGPGVTSGVVHFLTKSPIDKPGTTVELLAGNLNTKGISVRHATKVSDKFGFKVNAVFKKGDEFTLDAEEDAAQIARLRTTIRRPAITNDIVDATQPGEILLEASDLDPDGDGNPMQDFWNQKILNATLEFRPADDLSVNIAGGWNASEAVFYNSQGEGLSTGDEYWTQARMQKGGLFAQVFWLKNTGGSTDKPTFLYQTGNETGIARTQVEGQLQYNFDTPNFLDANWTTGFDYRSAVADTRHQVYGRFEDDDDYSIAGVYLQGKFALADKIDLVLAGRGDRFNFIDETAFSPRAVMVWKADPKHTVRFGFNRAIGAPGQLNANIDFPVAGIVPGALDVWLIGNKNEQTFAANAEIDIVNALPFPNIPVGTPGWPNAFTYAGVNEAVLAQLIPGLVAATGSEPLANAIGAYLSDPANSPGGFSGSFSGRNLFSGAPLGLINAPAAVLRKEDTWELGYKGLLGDKLGVTLDIYNKKVDGATLFTAISPTYTLDNPTLGADLGAAVADSDLRNFIVGALGGDANPDAGATADALLPAIQGAYTAGGDGFQGAITPLLTIIGTTSTEQVPDNGITHIAAGYRTFAPISYWGADLGLEYYANNELSFFGNYSMVSDNRFVAEVVGADGATAATSISVPLNKFRFGLNYVAESGLRINLAFQHDDSFFADLGQFSGDTDVKNLVDLGIGYKLDNGIMIAASANNLFNSEYRTFPSFPKIGRLMNVKFTYTFGADTE